LTNFKVISLLDSAYICCLILVIFTTVPKACHCTALRNVCCGHVQLSASCRWCLWTKWTWYSLILGWRLMAHTTVMYCWLSSCCLSCVRSLASSLSYIKS